MAEKDKKKELKVVLEREYVVPLRKEWLKVPIHKRTPKAVRALKQFIARHMKVSERDTKLVKINRYLNEELWFRSIKKPPAKIKVKAKKMDDGTVQVELYDIPKIVSYKMKREEKAKQETKKVKDKKAAEKKVEEKKEEKKETEEDKKEKEEKKEATVEAGLKQAEKDARQQKHEVGGKVTQPKHQFRKALKK